MKVLVLLVFAFGSSLFAGEGGSVKGVVKYGGEPPAPKKTPVPADKQGDCKCKEVDAEDLLVDKSSKGIKWAMVRVMDVKADPVPAPAATPGISQKGCRFEPRVTIIPPGTPVDMLNPDKVSHNVHTTPLDITNVPLNVMMAADADKLTIKAKNLLEPEIVQVTCDIHPWMKCFVVVHDPRFAAVTPADGSFEIKNVPPGKYKLVVYQESLGTKVTQGGKEGTEIDIEIKAGQTTDLGEITYKGK